MLKFETYDDAVYAHTDYVKFMREYAATLGPMWLTDRNNKYGEQAAVPSWFAWQHAIPDALGADICWISTEMMDLVQVAMRDFDMTEKVTTDDIFIPHGFMVLPHCFLSKDINGLTLGWRMLSWNTIDPMVKFVNENEDGYGYTFDTSFEGEPEGGVRFMQVSWTYDNDDWSDSEPELRDELRKAGENWGIAHATAIPFRFMSDMNETRGEGDYTADWLLFWRVAQKLMAERIVSSEIRHPGRPARRDAKRFEMPPPILRVIELRRAREEREGGEREGAPHWTHRWIVRGHWRNQFYPSTGEHKQKYIGEYVKGPEDLELIVKQRVWNWSR